jgi:hypothetical protein
MPYKIQERPDCPEGRVCPLRVLRNSCGKNTDQNGLIASRRPLPLQGLFIRSHRNRERISISGIQSFPRRTALNRPPFSPDSRGNINPCLLVGSSLLFSFSCMLRLRQAFSHRKLWRRWWLGQFTSLSCHWRLWAPRCLLPLNPAVGPPLAAWLGDSCFPLVRPLVGGGDFSVTPFHEERRPCLTSCLPVSR